MSFSACSWWRWEFWGVMVRYFVGHPSIRICLIYFHDYPTVLGLRKENHRGKFVYYQHDSLRFDVNLIHCTVILFFFLKTFFIMLRILWGLEWNKYPTKLNIFHCFRTVAVIIIIAWPYSTYYVPETILNTLHILLFLFLKKTFFWL